MKKDIETREDIYVLVKEFYKKLMTDDLISHFFEDISNPFLLEEHLQVLVNFWDNILFYSGEYRKNAMQPHLRLHQTKPFSSEHFKCWLSNFNSTVDLMFECEIAHAAKTRALLIATVMEIKINEL